MHILLFKKHGALCVFAGNTCFINTVVQVLRHTDGFVEKVHDLSRGVQELHLMYDQDEAVNIEDERAVNI